MIQNLETFVEGRNEECYEYEVITDSHIEGALIYGPYSIFVWDHDIFSEGEERTLCLRIKSNAKESFELPDVSKNGYYHGGYIEDEIIALSSLFLRRRLKLGSITRRNDLPYRESNKSGIAYKCLQKGEGNLLSLIEWFELIKKLNESLHLKYILAVRLYHRAILLIDEEPDLAYLNLVSAIEVLCRDTIIEKIPLLSDIDQNLATIVDKVSEPLRSELVEAIIHREKFITKKFVQFILSHIEDCFWEGERPRMGRVEPDSLKGYLTKIYNQRSSTLHEGKSFPPSIMSPPFYECEIDLFRTSIGERCWDEHDSIPQPDFFEKLVNHVLKVYLKRNSV